MEWITDAAAVEVASSEAHWRLKDVPPSVTYDDLFCAALEGVWKADESYQPNLMDNPEKDFTAWARARVRWSMRDYLRDVDPLSRKHRQAVTAGEAQAPEMVSWDSQVNSHGKWMPRALENRQLVLKALGLLDDKKRKVIECVYLKDMTAAETAEIVGCSENNVYQIKRAALDEMRG